MKKLVILISLLVLGGCKAVESEPEFPVTEGWWKEALK